MVCYLIRICYSDIMLSKWLNDMLRSEYGLSPPVVEPSFMVYISFTVHAHTGIFFFPQKMFPTQSGNAEIYASTEKMKEWKTFEHNVNCKLDEIFSKPMVLFSQP